MGKALTKEEREYLQKAASGLVSKFGNSITIMNIGVFRGASMYCLRAGAPLARLVGIDIENFSPYLDKSLRAEFILGDSTKCHASFCESVHLLFIDGDHHYEVVRQDLANWTPKVVTGGLVILHDYNPLEKDLRKNPHIEGVHRAVDEWRCVGWEALGAPNSLAAFRKASEAAPRD